MGAAYFCKNTIKRGEGAALRSVFKVLNSVLVILHSDAAKLVLPEILSDEGLPFRRRNRCPKSRFQHFYRETAITPDRGQIVLARFIMRT